VERRNCAAERTWCDRHPLKMITCLEITRDLGTMGGQHLPDWCADTAAPSCPSKVGGLGWWFNLNSGPVSPIRDFLFLYLGGACSYDKRNGGCPFERISAAVMNNSSHQQYEDRSQGVLHLYAIRPSNSIQLACSPYL
jgi:hypothetical protein